MGCAADRARVSSLSTERDLLRLRDTGIIAAALLRPNDAGRRGVCVPTLSVGTLKTKTPRKKISAGRHFFSTNRIPSHQHLSPAIFSQRPAAVCSSRSPNASLSASYFPISLLLSPRSQRLRVESISCIFPLQKLHYNAVSSPITPQNCIIMQFFVTFLPIYPSCQLSTLDC
jgi:hypothetical protein